MMKQEVPYSIAVSFVLLLAVQGLWAEETFKTEVELLKGQVPLLKRPEVKGTLKRAVAFGAIPFGVFETIWLSDEYGFARLSFPRAAIFGLIGAGMSAALASLYATVDTPLALAYQAYKRSAQARQINVILKQYANIDFYSLPLRESILVLAAYRHNLAMMKRWIPRLPLFIRKSGVWAALTQLYYQKEPTSELVRQLQKEIENT